MADDVNAMTSEIGLTRDGLWCVVVYLDGPGEKVKDVWDEMVGVVEKGNPMEVTYEGGWMKPVEDA